MDHGGPAAPFGHGLLAPCTSARRSVSTGRRWSRASSRSRTAACATRTCSPARTTRRRESHEILEDQIDAEVIFNGVGTVWNGIKLCPDQELALACFKVYNDWIADFQAYAPDRFICNGTLPTTGLDDAIAELHRCAELGLRTVQLESYPSGSFTDPSPDDDRFWAAAVELGMPINVHTQFFFPVGDLGSKITAEGCRRSRTRAKKLGVDVQAGSFPVILWRMIAVGRLRAVPRPQVRRLPRCTPGGFPTTWSGSTNRCMRNRRDWDLPLLPSEYFRRNVSVVYIVDEIGAHNRYDIGVGQHHVGPRLPALVVGWPVDYELGREILERGGATRSEIERIMWRNAADLYKLEYEEPATVRSAA